MATRRSVGSPSGEHDQLMKELLTCFPDQFLRLAAPRIAERIDLDTVEFSPEEHYPGSPTGRERRPDLVSRALAKVGEDEIDDGEVLLHVEIEFRYQSRKLPKLLSYHRGLSLKYALPVHTIVLYLHGGPRGAQSLIYEERSLGRVVGSVGYYSLGLSRMPAAQYVPSVPPRGNPVGPEPLAWALTVLMRPAKGQSRARLGLACVRRIAAAPDLSRREMALLFRCVWTYGRFDDDQAEEFDKIMAKLEDEEVQEMKMSMKEWWTKEALKEGLEKGREQGLEKGVKQGVKQGMEQGVKQGMEQGVKQGGASLLKRLLMRRFDDLPKWIDQRLEQASRRELEGWAERVLDAKRLEDVFSSA